MTSPNIMRLNLDKRNLHWCTLGAAVSCQLITTCVCANLSNKCSSQCCVLFRVQQHTTQVFCFFILSGLQVQVLLVDLRLAVRLIPYAAFPLLVHLLGRATQDVQPAHGLHHPGTRFYCKNCRYPSIGHRLNGNRSYKSLYNYSC